MKTARECLNEWHTETGSTVEVMPHIRTRKLCRRLIEEEAKEVKQAIIHTKQDPSNRAKLLKELCDLEYVVYYTAWLYGLDMDAGRQAVHESNMTKLTGGIKRRAWDGKIEKGDYYREPDMQKVVDRYDKEREGH